MTDYDHLAAVQRPTPEEVSERLRRFLETWPLYRTLTLRFDDPRPQPDWPSKIYLPCSSCGRTNPWELRHAEGSRRLTYRCMGCEKLTQTYWAKGGSTRAAKKRALDRMRTGETADGYDEFSYEKVGQYPAPRVEPEASVKRALKEEQLEFFRKAVICIEHSYGLGGLAYMRRVVEGATEELLTLLVDAARRAGAAERKKAIEEARKETIAANKLKLAAEALPTSLRVGGVNPLAILHADSSEGIHALTDDECLERASRLKFSLEYLLSSLQESAERAERYSREITARAGGHEA